MDNTNLPFYRTRKFWLVLIFSQILISFIFFLPTALSQNVAWGVPAAIFSVTGFGFYYGLVFLVVAGTSTTALYAAYFLYAVSTLYLFYKIFKSNKFQTKYAVFYLITAILSCYVTFLVLNSFN